MINDTEVFDVMHVETLTGHTKWTERVGTRDAIHRDGFVIDPISQKYCPQEWIDDRGYVDLELSRRHPYPHHDHEARAPAPSAG